jgi:hypothetical protein
MVNPMPKETSQNSLGAAEREAFRKLETELDEPMKFSMLGYNAIISSLAALGDILLKALRPSRILVTSLLLRLANDLRCCAFFAVIRCTLDGGSERRTRSNMISLRRRTDQTCAW